MKIKSLLTLLLLAGNICILSTAYTADAFNEYDTNDKNRIEHKESLTNAMLFSIIDQLQNNIFDNMQDGNNYNLSNCLTNMKAMLAYWLKNDGKHLIATLCSFKEVLQKDESYRKYQDEHYLNIAMSMFCLLKLHKNGLISDKNNIGKHNSILNEFKQYYSLNDKDFDEKCFLKILNIFKKIQNIEISKQCLNNQKDDYIATANIIVNCCKEFAKSIEEVKNSKAPDNKDDINNPLIVKHLNGANHCYLATSFNVLGAILSNLDDFTTKFNNEDEKSFQIESFIKKDREQYINNSKKEVYIYNDFFADALIKRIKYLELKYLDEFFEENQNLKNYKKQIQQFIKAQKRTFNNQKITGKVFWDSGNFYYYEKDKNGHEKNCNEIDNVNIDIGDVRYVTDNGSFEYDKNMFMKKKEFIEFDKKVRSCLGKNARYPDFFLIKDVEYDGQKIIDDINGFVNKALTNNPIIQFENEDDKSKFVIKLNGMLDKRNFREKLKKILSKNDSTFENKNEDDKNKFIDEKFRNLINKISSYYEMFDALDGKRQQSLSENLMHMIELFPSSKVRFEPVGGIYLSDYYNNDIASFINSEELIKNHPKSEYDNVVIGVDLDYDRVKSYVPKVIEQEFVPVINSKDNKINLTTYQLKGIGIRQTCPKDNGTNGHYYSLVNMNGKWYEIDTLAKKTYQNIKSLSDFCQKNQNEYSKSLPGFNLISYVKINTKTIS